jgi:hypothetical protein
MSREKVTVWISCNNPEKNKIGVYKYITRVLHEYGTGGEYYIKWRGYKWAVFFVDENNVKLKYQINL